MDDAVQDLWSAYLAAEADRIRHVMTAALERFIDALLARPEAEWHAWAKRCAASISDEGTDIPVRFPLFCRVLLPALAAGVSHGEPGCARWLARQESLLFHSDRSLLAPETQTAVGLLREALRIDPSDSIARRRLVERHASYLDYTLHELPAGVLFGADGATPDECDELMGLLDEFRGHLRVLGTQTKYEELIGDCELHYRAYAEYVRSGCPEGSYERFLERRRT
jgi:hypothetical protein